MTFYLVELDEGKIKTAFKVTELEVEQLIDNRPNRDGAFVK